jgi:DNA-binding LytR/AlgR family response regulator
LRNFFTRQVPGGNAMPAFVAKQRLLVKKGTAYQLLDVADLAYLFSENKVVFAVDCYQQKFLCLETNLSAVMTNLDSTQFFRANRKYGIHLRYLDRFYTDIRSRIILQLKLPGTEPVIISQENAALFRQWLDR